MSTYIPDSFLRAENGLNQITSDVSQVVKNVERLVQNLQAAEAALNKLQQTAPNGWAGLVAYVNAEAAANPSDPAWQTLKARMDKIVGDFVARKAQVKAINDAIAAAVQENPMSALTDLKARVAESTYLPNWLREGMAGLSEAQVAQPPASDNPLTKWCPHTRMHRKFIGFFAQGYNRMAMAVAGQPNQTAVIWENATCIGDRCMMWTGSDCGLKSYNLDMVALVNEVRIERDQRFDEVFGAEDDTPAEDTTP